MKTVLTIAGSDCSGGAGIQADIKTISAHGLYAMSAITALTAQNTLGIQEIMEIPPSFVLSQLKSIFDDIPPHAIKIGMVASKELILALHSFFQNLPEETLVIDPVMVSTSGSPLLAPDSVTTLKKHLLPLASLITPNIPEAEILSGKTIHKEEDMLLAAKTIYDEISVPVLVKGGHEINDANDLLYDNQGSRWFYGKRIQNPNTHGTGCTLSSAIAAHLTMGHSLEESIRLSKEYITSALNSGLNLGKGSGPLNHMYGIRTE